jgi:predicted transcriptional regulator of viral defense system
MKTITNTIIRRIRAKKRGWVFSPKDFLDLGSRMAVDKILSRLTANGIIRRIDRGIYDFPKHNKYVGTLSPHPDDIVKILAAKSGDSVLCSGAMAANALGLSTQVPARNVYLTNGASRIRTIGNTNIVLKHAKVPIFSNAPTAVNLVIQALSYLGKKGINDEVISLCTKKLSASDKSALSKTASRLPDWMLGAIHKIQGKHG